MVKLFGGVVVFYVGVVIEVEMKEKKDCVDDVFYVICVVVEEGIVVGGGVVLVRVINVLKDVEGVNEDEIIGIFIVKKVLEFLLRIIVDNVGVEGFVVL